MAERTQKSKGTTSRDTDATVEAAPAVTETGEALNGLRERRFRQIGHDIRFDAIFLQ